MLQQLHPKSLRWPPLAQGCWLLIADTAFTILIKRLTCEFEVQAHSSKSRSSSFHGFMSKWRPFKNMALGIGWFSMWIPSTRKQCNNHLIHILCNIIHSGELSRHRGPFWKHVIIITQRVTCSWSIWPWQCSLWVVHGLENQVRRILHCVDTKTTAQPRFTDVQDGWAQPRLCFWMSGQCGANRLFRRATYDGRLAKVHNWQSSSTIHVLQPVVHLLFFQEICCGMGRRLTTEETVGWYHLWSFHSCQGAVTFAKVS